jgi:hypothetical protein
VHACPLMIRRRVGRDPACLVRAAAGAAISRGVFPWLGVRLSAVTAHLAGLWRVAMPLTRMAKPVRLYEAYLGAR